MHLRSLNISASLTACIAFLGCSRESAPVAPVATSHAATAQYPSRTALAAPSFKVVHHDASSFTLVTKEDATDAEIESLVWQLHDASRTHGFGALKIDQQVVDKRDPIVWFHIYRGAKCATEKYTTAKLPCGDSYHAAGDYTLGSFKNPQRDDGVLRQADGHEVHLWNPDAGG